jgi:hypothetical protein
MLPTRQGGLPRAPGPLLAILFIVFLLPPLPSHASELSVLGGATESIDTGERSYAWQAAFRYNFHRNFSASLSWINEGHLEEHRRDGFAVQGWGHVPLLENRLSIGIGAGFYQYFDTRLFPAGNHENVHGWAPVYSLEATFYTETPWFAQAAVNHIVNKPGNDPGIGSGIEFRMGIDEHLDWTVTWLNEDVPGTFHRTGLGTQLWLVDAFLDRRITLGFGAGLYSYVDREPLPDTAENERLNIAGLVTVTASYRFSDPWFTRLNWNRVMSNDSRDSDIFLKAVALAGTVPKPKGDGVRSAQVTHGTFPLPM